MAGPSREELIAANICRAKWQKSKTRWDRRKAPTSELRNMLAGKFQSIAGGPYDTTDPTARAIAAMYDTEQTNTNLGLRATTSLKATACGGPWDVKAENAGDFPDELVMPVEETLTKVVEESGVRFEYEDAIDDVATVGPGIIRYGVGLRVIDLEFQAGLTKEIGELVTLAANAASGDVSAHPQRGMDLQQLAKSCRDFAADPEQQKLRTIEQIANLIRVAQEADAMWVKQTDERPDGYAYDGIWAERRTYGDDVFWDSTKTTRWQDAEWVGFLCSMSLEKAKREPTWKKSARDTIQATPVLPGDGREPLNVVGMEAGDVETLNGEFVYVEFWDRSTGEVHYFSESGGGWEGFLERDSRYPHAGSDGKPVLKDWFPMRACVPVKNNLRVPERTQGVPFLEPGRDHWVQYILFDSALTSCRKKAGDIIEVPDDLSEDERADIENAEPRAIVQRHGMATDGKPLITVHSFGESPIDFELGKKGALEGCSRAWDMTVPEMMGTSNEPTLGQEEMAASGARTSRGGLIRKLQGWAGEIARDFAALVRLRYSTERVASIAGPEFVKREPIFDDAGMPVPDPKDPTGQTQALAPSIWDLWKASSLCGDRFEVTFAPISRENDLMRAKSVDDFIALNGTQINPFTGTTYFDPRPILESEAKARLNIRLKPLKPNKDDLATMQKMAEAQAAGAGGGEPPAGGEPKGGGPSGHETPSGGRSDSRVRGGGRGSQPVPGRKERDNGTGDVGDRSVRVHRVGTS